MRKVAETIRKYLWGIPKAIVHRAMNALTEGLNSRIQEIKWTACGYRNRERFRNAINFHLGGLDLYPAGVGGAPTPTRGFDAKVMALYARGTTSREIQVHRSAAGSSCRMTSRGSSWAGRRRRG